MCYLLAAHVGDFTLGGCWLHILKSSQVWVQTEFLTERMEPWAPGFSVGVPLGLESFLGIASPMNQVSEPGEWLKTQKVLKIYSY